jgi:hypothetical protein
VFLHDYANAIWSLKGIEGPHLFPLIIFFRQIFLIILQKRQKKFILSRAIAISLVTSWLSPLQDTPPIPTIDLLQTVNFLYINMIDLLQAINYGYFHNYFELTWHPVTSSLFYFTHLYISLCFLIQLYKSLMISPSIPSFSDVRKVRTLY